MSETPTAPNPLIAVTAWDQAIADARGAELARNSGQILVDMFRTHLADLAAQHAAFGPDPADELDQAALAALNVQYQNTAGLLIVWEQVLAGSTVRADQAEATRADATPPPPAVS